MGSLDCIRSGCLESKITLFALFDDLISSANGTDNATKSAQLRGVMLNF
jgi:hypothetical protein